MRYLNVNPRICSRLATAAAAVVSLVTPIVVADPTPQIASTSAAARGDEVMGFDQAKTTHHFKLLPDGGIIEVTANDPSDIADRDAIRRHLTKIMAMFEQGDFSMPMLVHGQPPPGTDTMKRLRDQLHYSAENLPGGGQVRITTSNPEARNAVYDFLRFQIQEHKTGDATAEPGPAKRPHPANNLGHDARPAPP
jgi:hypothetical protein